MSLRLVDLNTTDVRTFMLDEFDQDVQSGQVYLSPRLLPTYHSTYIGLMRDAIQTGDVSSLANNIRQHGCLKSTEQRRTRTGYTTARVPRTAHITLAEGEFNRIYLRGLCRKAIQDGNMIEVYRAKEVRAPRPQSQALIGTHFDPSTLLNDLRVNIGVDTALGLPSGPNSGLSGRIA